MLDYARLSREVMKVLTDSSILLTSVFIDKCSRRGLELFKKKRKTKAKNKGKE